MNEMSVKQIVLMLILIVGIIAVVGMVKSTGNIVKTIDMPRKMCECRIEAYDYYGNIIGTEVHNIRFIGRPGRHNDRTCSAECNTQYSGTTNAIVSGSVAPSEYETIEFVRPKPYSRVQAYPSSI